MVAVASQPALPRHRAGPVPPPRAGSPLAQSRSSAMQPRADGRLSVRGLSQGSDSPRILLRAARLLRILCPYQPITIAKVLQPLVPSRFVACPPARASLAAAQNRAACPLAQLDRLARSLSLKYCRGRQLPFSVIDHRRIGERTTGSRKDGAEKRRLLLGATPCLTRRKCDSSLSTSLISGTPRCGSKPPRKRARP